jgi:hypothetical protein
MADIDNQGKLFHDSGTSQEMQKKINVNSKDSKIDKRHRLGSLARSTFFPCWLSTGADSSDASRYLGDDFFGGLTASETVIWKGG